METIPEDEEPEIICIGEFPKTQPKAPLPDMIFRSPARDLGSPQFSQPSPQYDPENNYHPYSLDDCEPSSPNYDPEATNLSDYLVMGEPMDDMGQYINGSSGNYQALWVNEEKWKGRINF
jgi:hypothetical protein